MFGLRNPRAPMNLANAARGNPLQRLGDKVRKSEGWASRKLGLKDPEERDHDNNKKRRDAMDIAAALEDFKTSDLPYRRALKRDRRDYGNRAPVVRSFKNGYS